MPIVTIGATAYDVYGALEDADEYLEASTSAVAWRDAEEIDKQRALVSATRILDRLKWKGEKTDEYQLLAWPRSEVGDPEVEDGTTPMGVIDASFELASILIAGDDPIPGNPAAGGTKRLKAGSTEIEYFRAFGAQPVLPRSILDLVGKWLLGATGTAGSKAFGTCRKAPFKKGYGYSQGI